MKNPLGKSRRVDEAYAEFGSQMLRTAWRVLKTYQLPKNEQKNQYARWFIAAKSPMTYDSWEMGDDYASEIMKYGRLRSATPEFAVAYRDHPILGAQVQALIDQGKVEVN